MSVNASAFAIHDERFRKIMGNRPKLEMLLEYQDYPFAHEAGVYIPETDEIFITSNQYLDDSDKKCIHITKVRLSDESGGIVREEIPSEEIPMANGGVNYKDGILFCAQGHQTSPSGLYFMSREEPYESTLLVSEFNGRPFNSTNDVVVHSDGSIWFTDPIYGYEQGFRPRPQLPNQVYRYDPENDSVRAMADGFGRPNGICFSPDEKIVYVTDTDWIHGDGRTDPMRPSNIYAFDIMWYSGQPFMANRRLFAMATNGIPDGIKCDMDGNVYSGCGDGINVWCPGGVLLGVIKVDGGAANFCFGKKGSMFILNEHKLWKAQLADTVKGALLQI
ncbi:SMP-30 Gluconolaconase LRE-like region protein [Rutstroemia sp. NJR-2017a WRK4]|nr:SMP-30 Gluconolaconase LRE-like region protein [Rutstroemia sp. NJR-2017a WRK4]